jgi:hypothetical protein
MIEIKAYIEKPLNQHVNSFEFVCEKWQPICFFEFYPLIVKQPNF